MAAETLNCPMCGAPAATDAARCDHCGARLASVACPSCFGMVFVGALFCSHCGAKIEPPGISAPTNQLCPRCQVAMSSVALGSIKLLECARCEGIWVEAETLRQICTDREEQAAVLGMAAALPAAETAELEIRYLPCPVCDKLMNRVNFAHCSHIVVDVCTRHGTWCDKDELRGIVEFIRAGGFEQERAREISELEEKRRQRTTGKIIDDWQAAGPPAGGPGGDLHTAISAVATVLRTLLGD
jgi:Zn-finger nucleic acid-binding protein